LNAREHHARSKAKAGGGRGRAAVARS